MKRYLQKKIYSRAFTLMEVMVVIILITIMAAFAIPNYSDSVNRTRVRDAVSQLSVLNAANSVYFAQNNAYLPGSPAVTDAIGIDAINTGLNLNLIANGLTYSYARATTTTYAATATLGSTFQVRVNQSSISTTNPCCCSSVSTCFSVISACTSGC